MNDRENTEVTLRAYAREANIYAELTRHADFAWWHALASALVPPPARVLDLGCGTGRDVHAFAALGYDAHGVEGCAVLAPLSARVRVMNVLDMQWLAEWDLVVANAVLHHLPQSTLGQVLAGIATGLRVGGALLALVPAGSGEEGWARGRFVRHLSALAWRAQLGAFQDVRCDARGEWLVLTARK